MQCDECGKDFRQNRWWQHFCSTKCRNDFHNRETSEVCREHYRREVLAHEARINGFTHIELVANPPLQLKGPRLGLLPLEKKEEEVEEQEQIA